MISTIEKLIFRAWYYFRTGYGTYLSFPLGFVSFISTTYYLTINNIPVLTKIFPNFWSYVFTVGLIVPPMGIFFGWIHMKKTLAYSSQLDVGIEANPYTYKLRPGLTKELVWPISLLSLTMWETLLEKQDAITPEIKASISEKRALIKHVLAGGHIGAPSDLRSSLLHKKQNKKRGV